MGRTAGEVVRGEAEQPRSVSDDATKLTVTWMYLSKSSTGFSEPLIRTSSSVNVSAGGDSCDDENSRCCWCASSAGNRFNAAADSEKW